jgi:hypothetical protein
MTATALAPPRFVRRTQLGAHEYRKNFHQIDHDVMAAVTSVAADRVTPLMSKIYLRLVSAPSEFWEREGVLYFAPRDTDGHPVKASKVLYEVLGVASATAHKALQWLHEQGIIGYFAGKNGVGIRIFLNRATSSIGMREGTASKKILPFARGSNVSTHGSTAEPAFKDSFADPDVLDSDKDPRAPQSGAPEIATDDELSLHNPQAADRRTLDLRAQANEHISDRAGIRTSEQLVARLASEIVPQMRAAAAAEHERTREWFITHALPKAIRVSQRSAYDVLRNYGLVNAPRAQQHGRAKYALDVSEPMPAQTVPQALSDDDITELAYSCIALLEVHGQAIDRTIIDMSGAAGGFLLPADALKVRAQAEALILAGQAKE